MAKLTPLPFDDAHELVAHFGLELVDMQALEAGSVNSNFFLEARSIAGSQASADPTLLNRFFARIYEEQGQKGACFEVELSERLARCHLPVARPLRTLDGEALVFYGEKPFAVYERLQGHVLCQKMVTAKACYAVGRALAQVHLASLGDFEVAQGRFGLQGILERLARVEAAGRADLMPAVERGRELAQRLASSRVAALPAGLIHGDLFRDNVLIVDQKVSGLLDFESACFGAYVYDLMVTMLAWCYSHRLEPELVQQMVAGYQSLRPLGPVERSAMVSEGSFACLRFASTRLTDFSLRAALGQPPKRNYARFFQRLDALEGGALQQILPELLG